MKNLQKTLLLLVLLTFSGCQLEWRKEFNMDFPVFDMKFLDYFGSGYTYVDTDGDKHKYIKSGYTLGGYEYEGFYVASEFDNLMRGNFGTKNDDGSFTTNLIATVDTSTSNITIVKVDPFLDSIAEKSGSLVYYMDYTDAVFDGYEELTGTTYEYDANNKTITIEGREYTYLEVDPVEVKKDQPLNNEPSPANYLVGNFDSTEEYPSGWINGNVYYRVQVMVDLATGDVMVIKPREILDYFVENVKTYGDEEYTFSRVSGGARLMSGNYIYTGGGMFTKDGSKIVFASFTSSVYSDMDLLGNITITEVKYS